jgi:hypothetical protein
MVIHVGSEGRRVPEKLVAQDLFLSRDLRQLADALASGKVLWPSAWRSPVDPFVDAGLPLKPVPTPKEGLPSSNGFGVLCDQESAPSQRDQGLRQLVSQ